MRFCLFALLATTRTCGASFCDEWKIVWKDEFDMNSLDNANWSMDLEGGDSMVRDSQGTADNVWVEDGNLVLQTKKETTGEYNYTSGAVFSKGKVSFQGPARVCVRAKLPGGEGGGNGIWPAHWLMPDNDACWPSNGEIDIMEMVNGDGDLHGTYHWQTDGNCNDTPQTHPSITGDTRVSTFDSAYHEYAVEYYADHILFALDGKVYKNITVGEDVSDTGTKGLPVEMFDVPYYIKLNTAVGGPWPLPPDDSTNFPQFHIIDYVRFAQP